MQSKYFSYNLSIALTPLNQCENEIKLHVNQERKFCKQNTNLFIVYFVEKIIFFQWIFLKWNSIQEL